MYLFVFQGADLIPGTENRVGDSDFVFQWIGIQWRNIGEFGLELHAGWVHGGGTGLRIGVGIALGFFSRLGYRGGSEMFYI